MELTKKEKEIIFWSMVNSYYQFKRDRNLANTHLHKNKERLSEILFSIDEKEKIYYEILEKFSIELGIQIPVYVMPENK